jgi:plastocyanin
MKSSFTLGLALLMAMQAMMSCQDAKPTESTSATDTVIISGMQFSPALLWANRGDTIVWINKDIVSHDVTGITNTELRSDTIAPGSSWKTTIGATMEYTCSIHPTMKAKVQIRE